jgi:hypothetical protein
MESMLMVLGFGKKICPFWSVGGSFCPRIMV